MREYKVDADFIGHDGLDYFFIKNTLDKFYIKWLTGETFYEDNFERCWWLSWDGGKGILCDNAGGGINQTSFEIKVNKGLVKKKKITKIPPPHLRYINYINASENLFAISYSGFGDYESHDYIRKFIFNLFGDKIYSLFEHLSWGELLVLRKPYMEKILYVNTTGKITNILIAPDEQTVAVLTDPHTENCKIIIWDLP